MSLLNPAPELLIFDLDGTLVESQGGIARSFNVALRAVGAPPVQHKQIYSLIGLPLQHMFEQLLPAPLHHVIPDGIAHYRAHYNTIEIPLTRAFPGVASTLAACCNAGRMLTVATTKGQLVAEQVLDASGLRQYFALVLGGDRVPRHKPAPDLVLLTLELTGYEPQRALVTGDSSYDMVMAAGAGVGSCGVTYGAQPAAALRVAGANHLIDAMPELLPLVGIAG